MAFHNLDSTSSSLSANYMSGGSDSSITGRRGISLLSARKNLMSGSTKTTARPPPSMTLPKSPPISTNALPTHFMAQQGMSEPPGFLSEFLSDRKYQRAALELLASREVMRAQYRSLPSIPPNSPLAATLTSQERELYERYSTSHAANANVQNIKLNRYADVLPYDHTCVFVPPSTSGTHEYLNASWVRDGTGRTWIAGQGKRYVLSSSFQSCAHVTSRFTDLSFPSPSPCDHSNIPLPPNNSNPSFSASTSHRSIDRGARRRSSQSSRVPAQDYRTRRLSVL